MTRNRKITDPFDLIEEDMFDRLGDSRPEKHGKKELFAKLMDSSGSLLKTLKQEAKEIVPAFSVKKRRFKRYRKYGPLPLPIKQKAPVSTDSVPKDALDFPKVRTGSRNWLMKIIGLSEASRERILMEVEVVTELCIKEMENQGLTLYSREMADFVSRKLTKKNAMRVAAVGGLTSAPATLPVLGSIGTATAGTTADFIYLIRTHVELCYQIAYIHGEEIYTEEMEAVVLALLGFVSSQMLVKDVVASTMNSVVDATAQKYLIKGIEAATFDVATVLTPKIFSRAFKILPLVSIPLSASINIYSTYIVGKMARNYFGTNSHRTMLTIPEL